MGDGDTTADAPERCPICETPYDSVSVHEEGVAVNLIGNERFRRVCFEPISDDGQSLLRFYHHTHEQAGTAPPSRQGTPGGRVP